MPTTEPMKLELREREIWRKLIHLSARQERGELSEAEFLDLEVRLVQELGEIQEARRRLQ